MPTYAYDTAAPICDVRASGGSGTFGADSWDSAFGSGTYGMSVPGNRFSIGGGFVDTAGGGAVATDSSYKGHSSVAYVKSGVVQPATAIQLTSPSSVSPNVPWFLRPASDGCASGAVEVYQDETQNPGYFYGNVTAINTASKQFTITLQGGVAPAVGSYVTIGLGATSGEVQKVTAVTGSGGVGGSYVITVSAIGNTHGTGETLCHAFLCGAVARADDGGGMQNVGAATFADAVTKTGSGWAIGIGEAEGTTNHRVPGNFVVETTQQAGAALVPAYGFVHVFRFEQQGTPLNSQISYTYYLFYGTVGGGNSANTYSGNPASPGTPLTSITFTSGGPNTLSDQFAFRHGFWLWNAVVTRYRALRAYSGFEATWASGPVDVNTTATVNLTGNGTSWLTTPPQLSIYQPFAGMTVSGASLSPQPGGFLGASDGASIVAGSLVVTSNTSATVQIATGNAATSITIAEAVSGTIQALMISDPSPMDLAGLGASYCGDLFGPSVQNCYEHLLHRVAAHLRVLGNNRHTFYPLNVGSSGESSSGYHAAIQLATGNGGSGSSIALTNFLAATIVAVKPKVICLQIGEDNQPGNTAANINSAIAAWVADMQAIIGYLLNSGSAGCPNSYIVFLPFPPRLNTAASSTPANADPTCTFVQGCMAAITTANFPQLGNGQVLWTPAYGRQMWNDFAANPARYQSDQIHMNEQGISMVALVAAKQILAALETPAQPLVASAPVTIKF